METFLQQFPVVFHALNVGFLQTLRLFAVTLLGAIPLGLIIMFGSTSRFKPLSLVTNLFVWVIRGTPLMIQLLIIYYFPGLVMKVTFWAQGGKRPLCCLRRCLYCELCLLFLRNLPGRHPKHPRGAAGGRAGAGLDRQPDFL